MDFLSAKLRLAVQNDGTYLPRITRETCTDKFTVYSARRLIGSRIIESAAYCNQKLLAHLYLNSTQNPSVNWIIRLLLSLLCWPKVSLLSGGHCITRIVKRRKKGKQIDSPVLKPSLRYEDDSDKLLYLLCWRRSHFKSTSSLFDFKIMILLFFFVVGIKNKKKLRLKKSILPNFVFLCFPIFAVKLECL